MADAKHTPGPWAYSTSSEGWSYTINIHQADDAAYTPDWSDIAFSTCRGEQQQIQEANARLIAAAPELLSLLQDAVTSFGPHIEGGDDEWLTFARDAIAKATGSAT